MNNKAFKDENLGNVLQSGIKIYTNMDKDVQKHYKMMLIMVASTRIKTNKLVVTILDSKTGGLVAISGGRDFKDVVNRNQATDPHPTGSSLKPS